MERAIFEQSTILAPVAEVEIPTATYRSIAARLVEAIGARNYFSGTISMPLTDLPEEFVAPITPAIPASATQAPDTSATSATPASLTSTEPATPTPSSISAELSISVIVYRNAEGEICDLVPVWWELSTYRDDEEVLNDFSFRFLRAIIID